MARNFITANSESIEYSRISPGTVYTFACRFRPTLVDSNFHTIFGQRSTTDTSISTGMIALANNNELRWFVIDDAETGQIDLRATAPTVDVWTNVVGTRNGDNFEIFVEGVSAATGSDVFGAITNDDLLLIGAAVNGSSSKTSFFDGDIADCAIWSVQLTDDEVVAYDKGVSPAQIRPDSLIFYAPLWGTTLENDISGNAKVGTLNNTPAVAATNPVSGPYRKRAVPIQASVLKQGFCVSGIVTEEGVPVAATVRVYLRSTGAFIDEVVSNAVTGEYTICEIASAAEVFVIAFDPAGGKSFNAEIFDKVIPVE